MGKKSNAPVRERRAKVEEMRRQQAAAERRKTLLFVGVSIVAGLGLIAAAAAPAIMKSINDPSKKPLTSFGVSAAAASCDAPVDDPAPEGGEANHVPDGTKVQYPNVPPSSGKHYQNWASTERKFYSGDDRPRIENLVHNLEHGYTIVWYDDTIKGEDRKALENISDKIGGEPSTRKIIVSAWDSSYGAFPAGKHIGMSHWSADKKGHRQLCGQVSGEAIGAFMKKYPQTDAPEPNTP